MLATLNVPAQLHDTVAEFVRVEKIPVTLRDLPDCTVRVCLTPGEAESDLKTLHAGGWITCSTARAIAAQLKMDGRKMGRLLNLLNIRIRECQLGCF